ncbi:M16 family metallopeptidase [Desulfobacula sp.]|uniref:M16 family metallopeptidase n=1 Tax=Desulfobacula sp. TaxID=2593537 RepID=UPI00261EA97D|nr:M16 family metallopeptidase [Desulfobacula sp.]
MIHRTCSVNAARILFFGLLCLFACAPKHPIVAPPINGSQIDPGIVYGTLPNGFQYVLMGNSLPEDKVSIHLNVFAGSMNETDDQQGVAHYLEHLLFNGSAHFKPGELIEYFQSIGMDFGADANASTGFFNTVYDLSLPKADYQHLDKAFVVIQDYARGASLLETEVDRERGIILAEKRERDSVDYRTFKKTLEFELPGSLFNQRFPIGIDTLLKTADRDLLKAYYDQWYRPDNMVLIVVGDIETQTVLPMIEKRFSRLRPHGFFVNKPVSVQWKDHQGIKPFYYHEPEAGSTEITIETISWEPFDRETVDILKQRMLRHIANAMVQNRLSRRISKQTADFSDASIFSGSFLHHMAVSAIRATCEPDKWEKVLGQIETTLRQALEYGFTQQELDRVTADVLSSLEQRQAQAASQKSSDLSRQILTTINQRGLLLSAEQKKAILEPYIQSISLQQVHGAFKALWSQDHRLILITGNADIHTKEPEATIRDVYQASLNTPVTRIEDGEAKIFPYLELPASVQGIRSRQDDVNGLGITRLEFQNNIRLTLKQTDHKQNEVLFNVCFGDGKKSEPLSTPGLSRLSEAVIKTSGLGTLDMDELEEALAGKETRIGFEIKENYFSLSGSSTSNEAALVFQLIYHYLNDPGYRQTALDLAKRLYKQSYDSHVRTPEGIMHIKGDAFLAGKDPRFGMPQPEIINPYTLDDIQHWLTPYFQTAPVDISIVGDFDLETMIQLASPYIGAFNEREKFSIQGTRPEKIYFPKGEQLELKIDTKIDTGVVHVAFLTDDYWDIMQTRRLSILSRVFSERLRRVIREDLGETYSPYAYNDPSKNFNGYGVLHVVAAVKSESHQFVYRKIKEIVQDMTSTGISKKEAGLALKPVLNHLKVLQKNNGYWLNAVMANASKYPQKFNWANTMMADYTSITHADLTALAKKYLSMDNSALITIEPSI